MWRTGPHSLSQSPAVLGACRVQMSLDGGAVAQTGTGEEVKAARHALDVAFARARAGGYRPGSPEMHRLEGAEAAYRQAKQRQQAKQHEQSGAGGPAARRGDVPLTASPGRPVDAGDLAAGLQPRAARSGVLADSAQP